MCLVTPKYFFNDVLKWIQSTRNKFCELFRASWGNAIAWFTRENCSNLIDKVEVLILVIIFNGNKKWMSIILFLANVSKNLFLLKQWAILLFRTSARIFKIILENEFSILRKGNFLFGFLGRDFFSFWKKVSLSWLFSFVAPLQSFVITIFFFINSFRLRANRHMITRRTKQWTPPLLPLPKRERTFRTLMKSERKKQQLCS